MGPRHFAPKHVCVQKCFHLGINTHGTKRTSKCSPFSPYLSLAQPEEDLRDLQHADDVVIPHANIEVKVHYPLFRPFVFHVQAPNGAQAFTRRALAQSISDLYHRIYARRRRRSAPAPQGMHASAATVAGHMG